MKIEEKGFEYYVDEKKGVCVCKSPNIMAEFYQEAILFFQNKVGVNCFSDSVGLWLDKHCDIITGLTGKARCNFEEGEIFDAKQGCELARKRLIAKIASWRVKMYSFICHSLQETRLEGLKRVKGNIMIWETAMEYIDNYCDNNEQE